MREVAAARIGSVPLPLYLVLVVALAGSLAAPGKAPLIGGLLFPIVGGIALGELARRIAFLRATGLGTALAILLPSWLAWTHVIPEGSAAALRGMLEAIDGVPFYVTVLIAGSVMSVDRASLPSGALRLLVLMMVATVAAVACTAAFALLLGQSVVETLLLVVAPVMSGGISAGAIPLSLGYGEAFGVAKDELLARMMPPLIVGNLLAMLLAGVVGRRQPEPLAECGVQPAQSLLPTRDDDGRSSGNLALGLVALLALHLAAGQIGLAADWPSPLVVLLLATALRLADPLTGRARAGIVAFYRLVVPVLIYPVLFIAGALFTPWGAFVEGLAPAKLLPVIAAVGGLALGGAIMARSLGFPATDATILALTRAAMGGTGTVAVLTAGRRLQLMAPAQILTRLGGAAMLSAALAAAGMLKG
ncbi:hypothetical protein ASE63_22155 [Bosea sp. Root381]|uniref:2-hydroxycarboxylate transporter family protein n=1 Tax=Bosea sp. Root381 TaxID=1736524 RepID=UPI0006F8AF06|nr:2-hydroxycarboxylate transporter family protein [Bosea sp. Root381]KRE08031.1 hypothetical protein ASE63_22155 [Bosea sp. Root381]